MTLELLIILPTLFAVMFLGMQAALYHHARTVAIAAAQEGARAAAAEHARSSDGTRAARAYLADAGDDVLTSARVTGDRTPSVAHVTVIGRSLSVIPGWRPVVRQSASAPTERLTAP